MPAVMAAPIVGENSVGKCAFCRNESGAPTIEYGIIAAGIAVGIMAVVQGRRSAISRC